MSITIAQEGILSVILINHAYHQASVSDSIRNIVIVMAASVAFRAEAEPIPNEKPTPNETHHLPSHWQYKCFVRHARVKLELVRHVSRCG